MKKKVLLVEREWEFAGRLPELLVDMGMEVEVVANGPLALGSLREGLPDLIVAESNMRGFEGQDLLQSLRGLKLLEHIPVLVTAQNREESEQARRDGVFVRSWPYEPGELAKFIGCMA